MPTQTFRHVIQKLANDARSTYQKGHSFERLVRSFIEQDRAQQARFSRVWLWSDWPGNDGRSDYGIDLVAEERHSGDLVAIQCKFYDPSGSIHLDDITTFLAALGEQRFASGIVVSTTEHWTLNAHRSVTNFGKPIVIWNADIFDVSSIDWSEFKLDRPSVLRAREKRELYEHQQDAATDVHDGFKDHDRGKLIMACGTGKTFTALRIAEREVGVGKLVLVAVPSISLLSQSLIEWGNEASIPLATLAVCSDTKVGRRSTYDEDISPNYLRHPATTDPVELLAAYRHVAGPDRMTAIFCTYQSMDVISQAQQLGLPRFKLIVSDEAHRTTGTMVAFGAEQGFQMIHDDRHVSGHKRLYMTATPRIYGDRAKRRANEDRVMLASMDDEGVYGPEFHRLGFGEATDRELLTPYKVVILEVDSEQVAVDLEGILSDAGNELNMDNSAKMVGCWNGLSKRALPGSHDFDVDPHPARRAVAFSNTIRESKLFAEHFSSVVERCIAMGEGEQLHCKVQHVDGTQNALERANRLAWLRDEPEPGTCRLLSNARCLTEGVDVVALDAVMFMNPRKSEIDVVQAVGRVTRRAPGKQFGYIILPIARAPGVSAQDAVAGSSYKAVWQVINAISSHDDRFEAVVQQLALTHEPGEVAKTADYGSEVSIGRAEPDYERAGETGIQGRLLIAGSPELKDAILSKIVDKYADPGYWERWARIVGEIAERHETRIKALVKGKTTSVRREFDLFLSSLHQNLNDGIDEDDAIAMLSQHLITKPVFDALFADYPFTRRNQVSRAMQSTVEMLEEFGLEKETAELDRFYRDVAVHVEGIDDAAGRQKVITQLYDRFFKQAMPKVAEKLGITYTPVEAVDYVVRSVEDVLQEHFGASLSDEGIHILEPFAGTGTFVQRLLTSGVIRPEDMERKYRSEIHANEMVLLAYYIAAVNTESTYHDLMDAGEYEPFRGMVLTDTFEDYEQERPMDEELFPSNSARIQRQRRMDIRVVMGNPPWSVGQRSQNDDNQNRVYPQLRERVRETYGRMSSAAGKSRGQDSYIQAIRWASDRVLEKPEGGVVAFVTNGGFIDSASADGLRKTLCEEFHQVYCYNLRGNARTSGEKRKQEGGGLFDAGSRAGVAILVLVKQPGESPGAVVKYRDVGDYLTREQKLAVLRDARLATTEWQTITPDQHGDWVKQRTGDYQNLFPLYGDGGVFLLDSLGIVTNRDAWVYDFNKTKLLDKTSAMLEFYNAQTPTDKPDMNPTKFSWTDPLMRMARKGAHIVHSSDHSDIATYRPFCKENVYRQKEVIHRLSQQNQIFPYPGAENIGIAVVDRSKIVPFSAIMTAALPDFVLMGAGVPTRYLPRWTYRERDAMEVQANPDAEKYEKSSNINPDALAHVRAHYGNRRISEDDLFHYCYGALHHQGWREKYADDLRKDIPRVPLADTCAEFRAVVRAGQQLSNLHVNYESADPYPLSADFAPEWDPSTPDAYRVTRMKYAGKTGNWDKSTIVYNSGITLRGVPLGAQEYRLGARSALDWIVDRYRITTDKDSGIVKDPNDWCDEVGDPCYILDLVRRITTVSVMTNAIVQGLPDLGI